MTAIAVPRSKAVPRAGVARATAPVSCAEVARSDELRSDEVRSDEARNDEARNDDARSDDARGNEVLSDKARGGEARGGEVRSGEVRSDEARRDDALQTEGARSGETRRHDALRSDEVPRHAVWLVVVDPAGQRPPQLARFAELPRLLRAGDLVVVNDAATLPGSLRGATADGSRFELRLSGPVEATRLPGVLLGPGDHRTRTEDRPRPPRVAPGERLTIAGLPATVLAVAGRRVELAVRCDSDRLWQTLYAAGAPVQYAHRPEALPLWSLQTAYAARPWAAEMPSAGRALTWEVVIGLRRAGVAIAALTHAAGLSSTGDDELDRALPWPERYEIPARTADAIAAARARGGRVIAVGTTVVRALESAAEPEGSRCPVRAGSGVATLRLDAAYRPRVVSGLVSGLHVPGESHFELLTAFAAREPLRQAIALAARNGLSGHELGDACLILGERSGPRS